MDKKEKTYLIIYTTIVFVFIIFTTRYLSVEELIYKFGQRDIEQYFLLTELWPNLPRNEGILPHVATRFLVPYIIKTFSIFLNLDLFYTYKLFTLIFLLTEIFFLNFLAKALGLSFYKSILFISLIILNPYIMRSHLFNPVQAHDVLFFVLTIFYTYSVIKNKKNLLITITILSIFLRQTSIALFIGTLFFLYIYNEKKLKIFIFVFIYLLLYKILNIIGQTITPGEFDARYGYGIIYYDFNQITPLIKFLLLPVVSYFPLILLILLKFKKKIDYKISLTLFLIILLMIAQPILGGPTFTQRNVVRIATFSYIIATSFIFITFDVDKIINKKIIYTVFVVGLFMWSLHPLYSRMNIFNIIRF